MHSVILSERIKAQPENVDRYLYHVFQNIFVLPKARDIRMKLKGMSFEKFQNLINKLDYIADREGREEIRSPWVVLDLRGGDCDDVAMFTAFWAVSNGFKFCWLQQGEGREIKHILTRVYDGRQIYTIDPFGSSKFRTMFVGHWRS